MKKGIYLLIFGVTAFMNAQPDSLFFKANVIKDATVPPEWLQKNQFGVDLSEVAFVNWNSGGSNSISAVFKIESSANYKDKYYFWNNNIEARYGLNKQQKQSLRKTDDVLEINSNMGYKPDSLSNWFYSARLNFKTQLTNGYNYPNTSNLISQFMAPGYLFFGGGMEYGKHIEELSVYFSPMTLKTTFVYNEALSNFGAFGVTPAVLDTEGNIIRNGENIRKEAGILFTNSFEKQLFENIKVKHKVNLYTDYINHFGNIDVDWQINVDFKVNQYVKASLGSHIKYDNDIKRQLPSEIEGEFDQAGAIAQWKQLLGIGFALDF